MTDRIHAFKVDDWVDIVPSTLRWAAPGRYQIVRLVPCDSNEPRYCVRSALEKHDRVVPECDLVQLPEPDLWSVVEHGRGSTITAAEQGRDHRQRSKGAFK